MLLNIIDKRERPYRWKHVNAIIEDTWHDNSVADGDQARRDAPYEMPYNQREDISVTEAVEWAMSEPAEVTLFLYDLGGGFGVFGSAS